MKSLENIVVGSLLLGILLSQSTVMAVDQWTINTISDGYRVGQYTSLEILPSGDPAISYYDYADKDLEYSWQQDGQWYTEAIDADGDVGSYSSQMLLFDGQPAISYIDQTNKDLKFARLDQDEWQIEVVDDDAVAGYTCACLLPSGYPAISFLGTDGLKYAWYDGISWQSVLVDAFTKQQGQTSMTLVNGYPMIAYYDAVNQDLKIATLVGDQPSDPSLWSIEVLDRKGNVGYYNSITTSLSGDPMVCYYDSTHQDLKFTSVESSPFGLKHWTEPIIIDAEGRAGEYCSMAILSGATRPYLAGMPIISYFHKADDQLRFAWYDGSQWHINVADSSGWVGRYSSLKILDSGEPAVSYNVNNLETGVRYATFHGFGWNTEPVDVSLWEGQYVSLDVLSSGEPAVAYQDALLNLAFSWFDGTAWQTQTAADEKGGIQWISMAQVNGQPAMSYQHTKGWTLRYAWNDGIQWHIDRVDNAPQSGAYSSLAVSPVDQLPRISYAGNDDLRYAWHDGVTWHSGIVIDGDGDVGYHTSLAFLPSGNPAISYWDRTHTNLKYAEFTGTDESNPDHWTTKTVDSVKNVGEWTSLTIWNNEPAVSYYDNTNRHLKVAWRVNGQWQTTTVDTGKNTGTYSNIAIVNNRLSISYISNGNLKLAQLTGSDPTNPLHWETHVIDNGSIRYNSLVSYGGYPAIAYYDNASCDLNFAVACTSE